MSAATLEVKQLPGRLLNKSEAAAYLNISVTTLDGLVRAGKLKVVRPTAQRLGWTVALLDEFITASTK